VLNRYNEQKKKTHQRKRTDVALSYPGSGSSTTDKQVTTQCESELPMDETSAQTEAVSCAPVSSVIPVMNSTQNILHFESHNCFDSVIPSTEMEQQQQGMLIDPEQKSTTLFLFFLQTLMLPPIVAAATAEDGSYALSHCHEIDLPKYYGDMNGMVFQKDQQQEQMKKLVWMRNYAWTMKVQKRKETQGTEIFTSLKRLWQKLWVYCTRNP